jgi:hypothetical protein
MDHKIHSASYHRNGIAGTGFYVAIVSTKIPEERKRVQFLCIDFTDTDPASFAVLRLDEAAKLNIGMHPITDPTTGKLIAGTGDNAWRGDRWAAELHEPIREWVARSYEAERTGKPRQTAASRS